AHRTMCRRNKSPGRLAATPFDKGGGGRLAACYDGAVPVDIVHSAMPDSAPLAVSFSDVQSAADLLQGHAHRTPVLTSRTVDEITGAKVFFKAENLQRGGAFKFRGAFNALSRLSEEAKRRGVVAFSSGNHAQAIALAGQ